MERLLGTAFDNLTSSDPYITKRGLRHIEALLAKLCLGKDTARLKDDDALREFLRLQERFEWNICQRLIAFLELYDPEQSDKGSAAAVGALHLLQGLLLLHTQSRNLFARETHMSLLLDLLDASSPPEVQSAALHALVCALVDTPANLRVFERMHGVASVTQLFKDGTTVHKMKLQILEFMYFYLMPEAATKETDPRRRVRTTEEKSALLGKYVSNVDVMVADLKESNFQPFG